MRLNPKVVINCNIEDTNGTYEVAISSGISPASCLFSCAREFSNINDIKVTREARTKGGRGARRVKRLDVCFANEHRCPVREEANATR